MSAAMVGHAAPDFNRWQIAYFEHLLGPLARPFEQTIERGEIGDETDVAGLPEVLIGPMVVRSVVMKQRLAPADVRRLANLVAQIARSGGTND
jgi:hypothetical protein